MYGNADPADPESDLVLVRKHSFADFQEGEHLVGLTVTYDDHIAWISNYNRVGILSPDFSYAPDPLQLPGNGEVEHENKLITNSFALHESGGIYIVNSLYMCKAQWDGEDKSLTLQWATKYHDVEPSIYWGRFGPGSGSSPTLMGTQENGLPEYVVITDGSKRMNILFFDAATGELVGKEPVTFGHKTQSTQSEQSVVVSGYKAVVVNNWFGDLEVNKLCHLMKLVKKIWPDAKWLSDKTVQGCPFLLGQYALGVEQFEISTDSSGNTTVASVWHKDDSSCTSSIPVVSEKDSTFYCIGKRDRTFTLEAIDWVTGEQKWFKDLGYTKNPFYAGAEIGTDNDLLVGTLLGPVRVVGG